MSHVGIMSLLLCVILFAGCSTVDRYAYKAERALMKEDGCQSQTTRSAPGYTTDISYRCVGTACSNYGCKE